MKKFPLWALLLYRWVIGCSSRNTLRTKDESYIEMMGGSGKITETMYEMETVLTCDGGMQTIKEAIGKYDAHFVDGGFRFGYYNGTSGSVLELGGGAVTTISQTTPRDYHPAGRNSTPLEDVLQSPYGFIDFGKDYDDFGWRLGIFYGEKLHYADKLIIPLLRYRWGRLDGFRMELGTMRSPTYLSSGSIADVGFGYFIDRIKTDLYLGTGLSRDYNNGQFIIQTETHTSKNFSIKTSANFGVIGHDANLSLEYGLGIGIKYQW
jgi:hypothetical protein